MISLTSSVVRRVAVVLLAAGAAACSMDKTKAPALAGPSEFGLSIDIGAFPDTVNRDGASQATIQVVARGPDGKPLAGRGFQLALDPVNGGVLSADSVVTGADGTARVIYTAASADLNIQKVRVGVAPVGSNYDNSRIPTIAIALRGSLAPNPDFEIFKPDNPKMFDTITFDATKTKLNGNQCDNACSYSWDFGDGQTATGRVVTHRYEHLGTYTVTLTATGPDNLSLSIRKTVAVAEAPKPTATIAVSSTTVEPGQAVRVSGATSVGQGGATVVKWEWDLGNGETATGPNASVTFDDEGAYVIVLTVTDNNGQSSSATVIVTVALADDGM